MKIRQILVAAIVIIILAILFTPKVTKVTGQQSPAQEPKLNIAVKEFLISKDSPLAQDTDFLLTQKHWKLVIAISAIESQYCKHQLAYNCWGVTKMKGGYEKYSSFKEGFKETNDLIERWQERGRWLTVDDMNCHYVQPCNPTWVKVVNKNLQILNEI